MVYGISHHVPPLLFCCTPNTLWKVLGLLQDYQHLAQHGSPSLALFPR